MHSTKEKSCAHTHTHTSNYISLQTQTHVNTWNLQTCK